MRTLGRLLAHGPRHWRPQTSSREIFILLAYLRGIQYTSFSYYFGVPIYRAVKEVATLERATALLISRYLPICGTEMREIEDKIL